ncbi:hypothetical protein [Moritella sp. F3]|uniref:hypothetical protein n=1 Tax=Moritella sp. F3 TaxID=2718882 RepID=UPI0018E104BB|nr:hypothetical protein [Moritella sp. F3]GIC77081.1 hypothetical protein FMO001_18080 [Moritella sp. F1]GIC82200.1 hypothetical protein FMO003_24810 [Moritella sp. F3]
MSTLSNVLTPMLQIEILAAKSKVDKAMRSHSVKRNHSLLSRAESNLRKLKRLKWNAVDLFTEFDSVKHTRTEMLDKFAIYASDFHSANEFLCNLEPHVVSTRY